MVFNKSIAISLAGHLMVFSFCSASFGRRPPEVSYSSPAFLGCVLNNFDLRQEVSLVRNELEVLTNKIGIEYLRNKAEAAGFAERVYLKPAVLMQPVFEKTVFIQKSILAAGSKERPVVMFYPRLPPYFSLYFKDRQVVHMELMFKIVPSPQHSQLSVKRKISSGNLEADLLCMRYISHYLFLQQDSFTSDSWQTVEIELSAKDNQ